MFVFNKNKSFDKKILVFIRKSIIRLFTVVNVRIYFI